MASNITSAGAASGMDFESIISASLEAKRAQLESQVTEKKELANIELSGVSKFKSALETFQTALEALNSEEGFNTRKVTTSQPTENPYFSITTKDDAANGSYDIAVQQLSSTEKVSQTFDSEDTIAPGTLTLNVLKPKIDEDTDELVYTQEEVKIEITEEINIAQLRRLINDQAGDLGINASIVETSEGSKLTIDSGLSGADSLGAQESTTDEDGEVTLSSLQNRLSISYESADGSDTGIGNRLNYDGRSSATESDGKLTSGSWTVTEGKDAIITVDGDTVTSNTNEFDDKISGLEITVNRVTENDDGDYDSYQVDIDQDIDGITSKVQNFVSAYNTLMDTLDSLGERNTYTDGESNFDGGDLAGDSQLQSLQRQLQSMMSDITYGEIDGYTLGLELDSEGRFSLDSTKFKEGISENFNAVVKLFSAEMPETDETSADGTEEKGGLIVRLDSIIEEYTKSNGFLDQRTQELNELISDYEDQEAENEDYLTQYEENLRSKYATLDTTIANYNNSLTYLQSVLG